MGVRKCIVCKHRRRMRGEKLCKNCLDYYRRKYGIRKNEDHLDNKKLSQLIEAYNREEENDEGRN